MKHLNLQTQETQSMTNTKKIIGRNIRVKTLRTKAYKKTLQAGREKHKLHVGEQYKLPVLMVGDGGEARR